MKKALITGITGQDGSYLAEFLLEKVMTYMEPSVVRPWIIVNVLLIWRDCLTSICIMLTLAIL